jgi:hypothetical protein
MGAGRLRVGANRPRGEHTGVDCNLDEGGLHSVAALAVSSVLIVIRAVMGV